MWFCVGERRRHGNSEQQILLMDVMLNVSVLKHILWELFHCLGLELEVRGQRSQTHVTSETVNGTGSVRTVHNEKYNRL